MKNLTYLFAIAMLIASCAPKNNGESTDNASALEANKNAFQRFVDQVINAHNVNMIDSFCHADFVNHNPDPGHSGKGIDDLKTTFTEFFTAFPDMKGTVNFMVAEGDKVVAHLNLSGTNTGPMGNMTPTNKPMSMDGIDIITIKDGKATERWGFFDNMSMMVQLGLMPAPGTVPNSAPAAQ